MQQNQLKIKIRGITKFFGDNLILDSLDMDVQEGKALVILGSSGTGKSVLIKSIIGIIKPDSGSIVIDGLEMNNISDNRRFEIMKNMGFLFQGGALFDSFTVEENITFFAKKLYNLSAKDAKNLASSKLNDVGLSPKILDLYPAELSGGMQKRVSLARAIATNPKIIFFDEPTTGLDPIMTNVINELIIKAQKDLNATTITITHDINSAYKIADIIAFMHDGKINWLGTKDEISATSNPYIRQFVAGSIHGPIQNQ